MCAAEMLLRWLLRCAAAFACCGPLLYALSWRASLLARKVGVSEGVVVGVEAGAVGGGVQVLLSRCWCEVLSRLRT
jgi:hypothetical protein